MADKRFRNVINGESVDAADGATYDITNPATGAVYAQAPASGEEDVDRAMKAAENAFEDWGDSTPGERQKALLKIADALESRAEEFVQVESDNTGKPLGLTMSEEMPMALDQIRFFAGAARVLEGRSAGEYMKDHTSYIRREPIGVVGQVTPWNYPLMMMIWKIAPALAAGNTIVLKPSDTTPASTTLFAEMAQEFLPPGVFNVVCGDRDTGRAVVEHPTPQLVSITGSVRAGMEVAGSAAKQLKRAHLELGGKAPVIVFDDADLEKAAAGIAEAGYFNAGQDCTAATRVLAGPKVHGDFVAALTEQAKEAKTGMPDDEDVLYGALNNQNQLERVTGMVDRLPDHAKVEIGGSRQGESGFFYSPTVVSGLQQDDEVDPGRDLRPGDHRAAVLRRGGGAALGQRREVRPRVVGLDQGPRPCDADGQGPRLRLRVDQHAHPDRRRDAARRLQAQRLRQGPLDVRARGLHTHQARHVLHRRLSQRAARNERAAWRRRVEQAPRPRYESSVTTRVETWCRRKATLDREDSLGRRRRRRRSVRCHRRAA